MWKQISKGGSYHGTRYLCDSWTVCHTTFGCLSDLGKWKVRREHKGRRKAHMLPLNWEFIGQARKTSR